LIITPVKDSVDTSMKTIARICQSKKEHRYLVYNDRSTPENRMALENKRDLGYELVNIEDKIDSPSPNYRFTLIDARKIALEINAHLLIVESDVFIKPDTIDRLMNLAENEDRCGMVAAITINESNEINFPYLHIKKKSTGIIETRHRVSFCCTLLTNDLLKSVDFNKLSTEKHWYDVQISKESRNLGFRNLIDTDLKVIHLPHSSRPWKKLKYENPLKYYLRKYFKKLDKI
jgi:GT2 family glycosyltransferase